jgi:uncharacterized membrane protein YfcA
VIVDAVAQLMHSAQMQEFLHLPTHSHLIRAGAGAVVGFVLGLVGGGGSILAVPLMVYAIGVRNPHVAIGTSALAVAGNAIINLRAHARADNVKWRCGGMYASAGVVGALIGSSLGKAFNGQKLLFLFALVMIVVGVLMLRGRGNPGNPGVECTIEKAPKVLGYGLVTGLFSGFFGIGGGFLIVPGLVGSTGMPIIKAIGTSLVAVAAFGLTTALNYTFSGLVDWPLAMTFLFGGALGGLFGAQVSKALSSKNDRLTTIFANLIFAVAGYMIAKTT